MSSVGALVRNEVQKTWRSRWLVFVVVFGVMVLIAVGIEIFYVVRDHRFSPPAPTPWQMTLRDQIRSDQVQLSNLETVRTQIGSRARVAGGAAGPFGRVQEVSIDQAIASTRQGMVDNQYLIDNDIEPVQASPLGAAAIFGLGSVIMFVLIRIFGWLASEQIAGERSDRTIAILLSRPTSRDRVLLAKAVGSFLVALATVLLMLLVVYALWALSFGSAGSVFGQVGVAVDGSQALGPSNIVVIPALAFALMCLGAAMLGVLCVQAMSFVVSVVTGRWAAVGITLAVLFAAPIVSGVIALVVALITGGLGNATFLNYLFFNLLTPVSAVAPAFGNGPSEVGEGMAVFGHELLALAGWTAFFFLAAWLLFRRRQEAV